MAWARKSHGKLLRRILRDERGVSAVEYGVLAALLGIASIQALTDVGQIMSARFAATSNEVGGADLMPSEPPLAPTPSDADPAPDPDFATGNGGNGNGGGASGGPPMSAASIADI